MDVTNSIQRLFSRSLSEQFIQEYNSTVVSSKEASKYVFIFLVAGTVAAIIPYLPAYGNFKEGEYADHLLFAIYYPFVHLALCAFAIPALFRLFGASLPDWLFLVIPFISGILCTLVVNAFALRGIHPLPVRQ